ncbi:hypothetical protein BDD30_3884 [Photorhabdus asymbiotica]|uniref:Uncharacterized protein n=1 Tax=Photorhabdus asymbiotica TaxID=291112 RepID=A0ABX9SJD5_9GAMM|nr:hypothetical protein BDD30_3884 [Photorhabdus asymbiotica]
MFIFILGLAEAFICRKDTGIVRPSVLLSRKEQSFIG